MFTQGLLVLGASASRPYIGIIGARTRSPQCGFGMIVPSGFTAVKEETRSGIVKALLACSYYSYFSQSPRSP